MAGPVVAALTASAYREVDVDGVAWRLRLLDPAAAGEARVILEMVRAITDLEPRPDDEFPTEGRPPTAKPRPITPELEAKAQRMVGSVLRACVVGVKLQGKPDWEPARIVMTLDEQDAERGCIWYGSLSDLLRARLYTEALVQVGEARQALRPFCPRAADPVPARPDGSEVREDAP